MEYYKNINKSIRHEYTKYTLLFILIFKREEREGFIYGLSSERNLQKLSVAQAAILCGFDISNIYRMESGNNVFLSTFLQYVYALGRPISTFIPFDESGNKPKSLGEQIDELTRGLDVFEKNYILNMVEQLVSFANCK